MYNHPLFVPKNRGLEPVPKHPDTLDQANINLSWSRHVWLVCTRSGVTRFPSFFFLPSLLPPFVMHFILASNCPCSCLSFLISVWCVHTQSVCLTLVCYPSCVDLMYLDFPSGRVVGSGGPQHSEPRPGLMCCLLIGILALSLVACVIRWYTVLGPWCFQL